MTDLDLYRIIMKYSSEFHEDGIFFVAPWNLKEFVTSLGIKDSENSVTAHIVTDGYIAVDAHDLALFCDDIEDVIKAINEDMNEYR